MSRVNRRACWGLLLTLLAWGPTGCDPSPPPSSPDPAEATGRVRQPAKLVSLVIPAARRPSTQLIEQFLRQETGKRGMLFRSFQPAANAPPSAQADQIRLALADRPMALMVVPERGPEVADALAESRLRKVPVVLIDVPLGSELPHPIVRNSEYSTDARKLVAAAIEDAREQGFPAQGPAVIARFDDDSDRTAERADALRHAAEDAGLTLLADVRYLVSEGAEGKILESIRKHPELAIILAEDDLGLTGAAGARMAMKPQGKFAIAGFAVQAPITMMNYEDEFAAVSDRNLMDTVREALAIAGVLSAGGPEPSSPVPVPLVFKRGTSDRTTERRRGFKVPKDYRGTAPAPDPRAEEPSPGGVRSDAGPGSSRPGQCPA